MRVKVLHHAFIVAVIVSSLAVLSLWFAHPHSVLATADSNPTLEQSQTSPLQVKGKPEEKPPEVNKQDEKSEGKKTHYSPESVYLVASLFVLLGFIFVLMMWYSNRMERTSYLGSIYRESVRDFEYNRYSGAYTEKWKGDGYQRDVMKDLKWLKDNPKPPPPPSQQEISDEALIWSKGSPNLRPGTWLTGLPGMSTTDNLGGPPPPPGEPPKKETEEERQNLQDQFKNYIKEVKKWYEVVYNESNRRYNEDLDKATKQADERAKKAIDVEWGVLRGRGAEFVLEFTAIVVIIFAAMSLGILGILNPEQIGTLLAAIAGYVLGKASSRSREPAKEASGTPEKT